MHTKTLKKIAVSEEKYLPLKKLGSAGDSFNDVVTEVLKQCLQTGPIERPTPGTGVQRQVQPRWSVIIPDMNSHVSASHKVYAMPANSDQIKQILKPTIVTICLTNMHEECTGNYVDTTNSFRIQCKCKCHLSRRINWELRK
jgi:hypothetical protein